MSRFAGLTSPLSTLAGSVNFHAQRRGYQTTMSLSSKLKPAARVSGQKQDVW